MTYYVKLCGKCRTPNEPSMTYCGKCGADLPTEKTESDVKAIQPPAYAIQAAQQAADEAQAAQQEKAIRQFDLHSNFGGRSPVECKIVDVEIPFISMVALMVKLVLASIPALIILGIISLFAFSFIAALFR